MFVEKPPCHTMQELNNLIEVGQQHVLVGFQKRYAPAYLILKEKMIAPQHYVMSYCTGAYPEGDMVMDLFIHAIDIVIYLFGESEIQSVVNVDSNTLFLHLKHKNGIVGSIELSTAYSWQSPVEKLKVVCKKGIFILNTTSELQYHTKPNLIANIPLEKIKKFTPTVKLLFNQNSFLPIMLHNTLFINGFWGELKHFIDICENKNSSNNLSDLISLLPTYKILEELKQYKSNIL